VASIEGTVEGDELVNGDGLFTTAVGLGRSEFASQPTVRIIRTSNAAIVACFMLPFRRDATPTVSSVRE
jgi:hypothetical protein